MMREVNIMKPTPIITVIRPVLTAEEREKRMQLVNQRIAEFWQAMERRSRDEKGEIRKDAESL